MEFVNSARLLQHATNMVRLHLSKAGIENHDRYLEDIAQEVSIAAWNQAHTVRNMPAYVNTAAAGHVRKFFRPKDRDSTDELATSIHLEEIERFELANDREMTRPERNALAEDIRENWDDWRSGRGKKGRKPRKKFHTYYEDKPQAISIDELPVEKPQDEYEEAVKTLERQRGIIGSINIADRRAARAYTEASRKLADQMGRELHPTEEDMLAKMIRKKWDGDHRFRPREDFHRRSSSFCNTNITSWADVAAGAMDDKLTRRTIAYNTLAEEYDIPPVQVGSIKYYSARKATKVLEKTSVSKAVQDWESGEENEAVKALFTPWPNATLQDQQDIVRVFQRHPEHAEGLWKSAISLGYSTTDFEEIGRQWRAGEENAV